MMINLIKVIIKFNIVHLRLDLKYEKIVVKYMGNSVIYGDSNKLSKILLTLTNI